MKHIESGDDFTMSSQDQFSVVLEKVLIDSFWKDENNIVYEVILFSNMSPTKKSGFIPTIIYKDSDNVVWSRSAMTVVNETSEMKDVDKLKSTYVHFQV